MEKLEPGCWWAKDCDLTYKLERYWNKFWKLTSGSTGRCWYFADDNCRWFRINHFCVVSDEDWNRIERESRRG